jgi:hypothetical protein
MKKLLVLCVLSLSMGSFAGPPKNTPADWKGGGEDHAQRREERAKKGRMMALLGLSEALELNEADTLKLSERLKAFDDRRAPIREAMGTAMKTLKAASEGDASVAAQVDQAVQQVLDGRAQLAALDKEMFVALTQGQTPQKKARVALFLAHFSQEMQRITHVSGGGEEHGR